MGNFIMQVAAPANIKQQAKATSPAPANNNGAEGFSIEMDEAVNKHGDAKATAAESAKERASEPEAGYGNEMDDMKETDKSDSVAAGLLIPPEAVPVKGAAMTSLSVSAKPVEYIQGQHDTCIGAAVVSEGVDDAETISPEGKSIKSLNEGALKHKYFGPQKLEEAVALPEDANDAREVVEEGKESLDIPKSTANDKAFKGEFVTSSSAQSAGAADDTPDTPDAKTAGAAAITLEQSDDSPGRGHGDNNGEKKGSYSHAGHRATDAVGVSQLSRQAAAYETVVAGGEITGAERAEVYEKLSTGVSISIAKDGGEVKLSLRPDHLGNLNIKLNIEDGKVNARIVVESAAVKEALDADTGTLREVFAKNNLVLDKYTVEIAGRHFSPENSFSNFSGFSGFEGNTREGFLPGSDRASATEVDLNAASAQTTGLRVSGIDLFI